MQVQASRVSARIAALTVLALALALTQHPVTPSDHEGRSAPDGRRQPATRRTACSAAKRNARRFQPAPIFARCRRNPRHSRANRPRQMERMGIACLQNRKAPTMERARRIRVDRTPVRVINKKVSLHVSRRFIAKIGPVMSAPVSFGTSAIARSSTLSSSRSFGTAMGWMIRVA